jgi:integrase/recombinase XerD
LDKLVRGYLDHLLVERGASPNTIAAYRRDLDRYSAFLAARGLTEADQVAEGDVLAFAAHLREDLGLAASSSARAVVAVRGFHRFLVDDRSSQANPAAEVKPSKAGQRLPKALDVAQVMAILEAPDLTTAAGLRDRALLELLYGTGGRISEILALDVDDYTQGVEQGFLRLFGKGRKERIVPLGGYARQAVDAWLVRGRPAWAATAKRPSPALLLASRGGRLSRQRAWALVRANAAAAGIGVEIGPHTLRHSFATHLLDGGADIRVVQELLGHASVTTTQLYTKVTVEHLREVFAASHPRAR